MDSGKSVCDARNIDVASVIACFRYYAGFADKIFGKVIDMSPDLLSYTRHEALGVVAGIIPWNFPLLMLAWKVAPAIACGNVSIIKTSEKTPLTGLKFGE
jgi:aldehyde dehydrogenase (NAD+)